MSKTPFIPGLELSRRFYNEAIKPILNAHYPNLAYAAALIGSGSEILGFDTPMSSDHHWGPRLMLFIPPEDHQHYRQDIHNTLAHELPYTFLGYPTHWGAPNPDDSNVQHLQAIEEGPINHRVEILTLQDYFADYLGIDPLAELSAATWLSIPSQKLRSITAGAVYHDGPGDLTRIRQRLAYYPDDIWFYLMAAQWVRISQEEAFIGRTGSVGDELGSRLIAARLVNDLMALCFLMQRCYAPYSKWYGTAFQQLKNAAQLTQLFNAVLSASTWTEREKHLSYAYAAIAEMHNALGITPPQESKVRSYFGRPFMVISGGRFVEALLACITDPEVKAIAQRTHIGGINQFTTNTNLLEDQDLQRQLEKLYRTGE